MSARPSRRCGLCAHAWMPRRACPSPLTGLSSWRMRGERPQAPALPRRGASAVRPPPRSAAPQAAARGGQGARDGQRRATQCAGPSAGRVPPMAGVTGWHRRHGRPGAPLPVGRCTLQVLPQGMPQPSTTSWGLGSPAWRLAGACGSRARVVCSASLHGRIGYLSLHGVTTCFHTACTAHRDAGADVGGRRLHCGVRRGLALTMRIQRVLGGQNEGATPPETGRLDVMKLFEHPLPDQGRRSHPSGLRKAFHRLDFFNR